MESDFNFGKGSVWLVALASSPDSYLRTKNLSLSVRTEEARKRRLEAQISELILFVVSDAPINISLII